MKTFQITLTASSAEAAAAALMLLAEVDEVGPAVDSIDEISLTSEGETFTADIVRVGDYAAEPAPEPAPMVDISGVFTGDNTAPEADDLPPGFKVIDLNDPEAMANDPIGRMLAGIFGTGTLDVKPDPDQR